MRGSLLALFLILVLPGCYGEYRLDAPLAETPTERPTTTHGARTASDVGAPFDSAAAETLRVDRTASEVAWKGTKMWGRGQHTGTVPIREGYLLLRAGTLVGGRIVVDMTSIRITDIPPDQPEPIELLTSHLEDPLFFDVAEYPTATFEITAVEKGESLTIEGPLTVRDVTRSIRFPAIRESGRPAWSTRFRIDRFDWNVAYEGGFGATRFAARNFVDRHIELAIRLVADRADS